MTIVNRVSHLLHGVSGGGTSWSIPLSMTALTGGGTQHQAGAGRPLTLAIVDKPASGRITMRGNGSAVSLASLSAGKSTGKGSIYCYLGPTSRIHDYLAAPLSRRFVASTEVGLTTWRDSGGWHFDYRPNPVLLDGADVVLPGGRINPIDGELRTALIAAGLDTYITLQEVRT